MPWMMPAAVGGASALGALAVGGAAKGQEQAAKRAANLQFGAGQQARADLAPWANAGNLSLDRLSYLMGIGDPMQGARDEFAMTAGLKKPTMQDAEAAHLQSHIKTFGTGYTADSDIAAKQSQVKQIYDQMLGEYNSKLGSMPGAPTSPNGDFGSLTKPFSMQDFEESPAYQFNLEQGKKAIDKAASARGMYYAPKTLQDVAKYSQGMASNEFQNAFGNYNTNMNNIWSRLYGLSGSGQNAAAGQGASGMNAASAAANSEMSGANAAAAGKIGAANAISGGVNSAYNAYLTNEILSRNQKGSVEPWKTPGIGYGMTDATMAGSPVW